MKIIARAGKPFRYNPNDPNHSDVCGVCSDLYEEGDKLDCVTVEYGKDRDTISVHEKCISPKIPTEELIPLSLFTA